MSRRRAMMIKTMMIPDSLLVCESQRWDDDTQDERSPLNSPAKVYRLKKAVCHKFRSKRRTTTVMTGQTDDGHM